MRVAIASKEATMKKDSITRSMDETFGPSIDEVIDGYKRQIASGSSVDFAKDRLVLLTIYDRLQIRKIRNEQKNFYNFATTKDITAKIIEMANEEVKQGK